MTTFAEHLRSVTADRPTAVYRFYDADDRLLYVGITYNLPGRLHDHQRNSPWWGEHRSVRVVWRDNRADALEEERVAIRGEKPLRNVAGTRALRECLVRRPDRATREAIAAEVRAEVARSWKSKAEIRELLGLSRQSAWQRMCGEIAFREEELHALAEFLGIPVSRFLPSQVAAA